MGCLDQGVSQGLISLDQMVSKHSFGGVWGYVKHIVQAGIPAELSQLTAVRPSALPQTS